MKIPFIQIAIITLLITSCSEHINSESNDIRQVINSFVKGADEGNVAVLKNVLHADFRVLANQLFGSEKMQVIPKEIYIKLISDGTIGGDDRKIEIIEMQVNGHNAYVRATFFGKTQNFDSFIILAQNTKGNWKIISDIPSVEGLHH